jgi:hypothetical protein
MGAAIASSRTFICESAATILHFPRRSTPSRKGWPTISRRPNCVRSKSEILGVPAHNHK